MSKYILEKMEIFSSIQSNPNLYVYLAQNKCDYKHSLVDFPF
jgi:hypothetical protein